MKKFMEEMIYPGYCNLKWYQKAMCIILTPFICTWFLVWVGVAYLGRGLYQFSDLMTGWHINEGNWMEDL